MKFFNFFNTTKKNCEQMIAFADKWSDIYVNQYSLSNDVSVKNGALIFCSWAIWDYCLNNDKLSEQSKDFANKYIASVCSFVNDTYTIDIIDFLELYKNRFKLYKSDLNGLLNSHYPQTKQYIPINLFASFYKKTYQIFTDPGFSFEDEDENIMNFMGKFIPFWNAMNNAMLNNEI